jgi:hypothetical protein
LRRHYPVQVHGSFAISHKTLSVIPPAGRFGSPNVTKLWRFPRSVKRALPPGARVYEPQECPDFSRCFIFNRASLI